jgi:hypothetical protein
MLPRYAILVLFALVVACTLGEQANADFSNPQSTLAAKEGKKSALGAEAKKKLEKQQQVDEHLFLVYVLERLARDTWATEASRDRIVSRQVLSRYKLQKLLEVDELIRHMEARKMDGDLQELFENYRRLMKTSEHVEKELATLEAKYNEPIIAMAQEFKALKGLIDVNAQLVATNSALDGVFGSGGDLFDRAFSGIVATMVGSNIASIQAQAQTQQAFRAFQKKYADYEKRNRPALDDQISRERKKYFVDFIDARNKWIENAKKKIPAIAKKFEWSEKESAFVPDEDLDGNWRADRPRDALRLISVSQGEVFKNPDGREARKKNIDMAEEMLNGLHKVPTSNAAYSYYRALLCATAAKLALDAAESEVGTTGFKGAAKNPAAGGRIAIRALEEFSKHAPADANNNGLYVVMWMKAHAYVGNKKPALASAFAIVRTPSWSQPSYLVCAARVFSVNGNPLAAYQALDLAFTLGFSDFEHVNTSPDFENLRAINAGAPFAALMKKHARSVTP